jgi:SP family myo-inositol transporter-like MFS transporter 13
MISLDNPSITTGQLLSYGIGVAFANVSAGWRYMAAIGVVPAIVLCTLLPFCPESPRQLVYHHKPDEAAKFIAKIFPDGTPLQVQQKVPHITIHVSQTRNDDKSLW